MKTRDFASGDPLFTAMRGMGRKKTAPQGARQSDREEVIRTQMDMRPDADHSGRKGLKMYCHLRTLQD
jgi:hypothetical protein